MVASGIRGCYATGSDGPSGPRTHDGDGQVTGWGVKMLFTPTNHSSKLFLEVLSVKIVSMMLKEHIWEAVAATLDQVL